MRALLAAGARNDAAGLASEIAKHPKLGGYAAQKLTARIAVSLVHCPRCKDGELKAEMHTGSGREVKRSALAVQGMDRQAVADFLRARR
jgi:hypothetical protein